MVGLPEVIGLLYRADWTRLSLSAGLRSETGREQGQDNGRYVGRGALLLGPGGRWRLECPVPGLGDEGGAAEGGAAEGGPVEGNDGEHGWSWRPPGTGGQPPGPAGVNGAAAPVPELLCPWRLLGGYTLEELGPVTVAGREAIAVAATPRRDVLGSGSGSASWPYDRIEVAVDAELGILLRRSETSGGELVTRTELTEVTMNPPEAADPARFAAPPGSQRRGTQGENPGATFGGPGWAAADVAAGGLDALIKYVSDLPGQGAPGQQPESMPSPDPAPLEAGGSPPPEEVLELLYRSGEPRTLGATARQWHDMAAMTAWGPEGVRAAGRGGLASLFDSMTRRMSVTRTDARLRVSGPERYRLDFSRQPRGADPTTIACDGERRWRVYQDRVMTGPAAPLRHDITFLADSCWLLRARLSGGAELTYRGRPARQLRVTPRPAGEEPILGLLMAFPADAIVDAATGCLLRVISYADDTPVVWSELDDISTEPADPDEFQVHVPPGTRTVAETGNLVADAVAVMPGVQGTAARAAAEAVHRMAGAVSAARSFLDDLRGHR